MIKPFDNVTDLHNCHRNAIGSSTLSHLTMLWIFKLSQSKSSNTQLNSHWQRCFGIWLIKDNRIKLPLQTSKHNGKTKNQHTWGSSSRRISTLSACGTTCHPQITTTKIKNSDNAIRRQNKRRHQTLKCAEPQQTLVGSHFVAIALTLKHFLRRPESETHFTIHQN